MKERGRLIRFATAAALGFVISSMATANSAGLIQANALATARLTTGVMAVVPGSVMSIQDEPAPAEPSKPANPGTTVTKETTTTIWYLNPVWLGVIVLAAVALIALIALAVRGGNDRTTVIRS
jgi:hypothetical protein